MRVTKYLVSSLLFSSLLFSSLLFSCQNNTDVTTNSSISAKLCKMQNAGLLDALTNDVAKSSLDSESLADIDSAVTLLSNPDNAMNEISESDSTGTGCELVDKIINNGTVGEIVDIVSKVAPDVSVEIFEEVKSQVNVVNQELYGCSLSDSAIESIPLSYSVDDTSNKSRSAYESNLDWDTIYWYYGMCAATIVGISVYKYTHWWHPFVKAAGLVAAIAGGASMASQLGIWYHCSDFRDWVSELAAANSADTSKLTKIANSSVGLKLMAISGVTAGVVTYCIAVCPKIKTLVSKYVLSWWNKIVNIVYSILPSDYVLSINGIKFVAITW